MYRWALFTVCWVAIAAPAPAIKQYCVGCHNAKVTTGGVALDRDADVATQEKVLRKLRARFMPPAGLPRPDEPAYQNLVAQLEASLDRAAATNPDPGRTDTFRRLNRTEYRNSIRDLLGLDVDVSSLLPSDDASHGFDNVTVGDLSPTLLERYLNAAQKISRLAIGIPPKSPGGETVTLPPDLTQEQHFDDLPLGTRGGLVVPYTFPADAEYEISVRLARDRNEHVEGISGSHQVEVLLDGDRLQSFTVKPPPSGQDHRVVDKNVHLRVSVKAGPHRVAATFVKMPTLLLETERQPYQAHFNMDRHPRIQPAVYSISVNGPFNATGGGDTPSRSRIFVCRTEDPACVKRIFGNLMRRAYRRPVTDADLQVPMKFYKQARDGGSFETGIEMGLRAILVSPEFIFRVEQDPTGVAPKTAYKISEQELASRLSFFLWSSIPDDELLDSAASANLRSGLKQQVRRMLLDQRSVSLVNNFAEQWLYLRNLASTNPDMRLFPDFDDNLRQAFRRETELLFEEVIREDLSVLDLLRSDHTYVNERLAKHYGIPNVYGSHFRKVRFDGRGGLLRQGSILTVTSYANRTSPVQRGKWVLSNLIGLAPPPPPATVPSLPEHNAIDRPVSMRDRMKQHRVDPACAGCHQIMDPVGFAMENYDAVGRWRRVDDASGGLPDGSKFDGVAGLEKALLERPELFVATLTEKLLTFALGRGVEYYDAPAIRKIVRDSKSQDYKFSALLLGIVNSVPFQMRRSQ